MGLPVLGHQKIEFVLNVRNSGFQCVWDIVERGRNDRDEGELSQLNNHSFTRVVFVHVPQLTA